MVELFYQFRSKKRPAFHVIGWVHSEEKECCKFLPRQLDCFDCHTKVEALLQVRGVPLPYLLR